MLADQFDLMLEGCDGSEWALHGPRSYFSPVRLEKGSVGDLFDAPVESTYKDRAGQAGSEYLGHRTLARVITLNLVVYSAEHDAFDWARVDSDFRKALAYDEDAVLRVSTEMSGERHIAVRLQEAPSFRGEIDPHENGISQYGVTLIAYDPYWKSDTYTDEYEFDGLNWYGDGVWIDNPGDVLCWPKWVLTSPAKFILPDHSFKPDEDAERTLVIPFQPEGRTAVVDTDPLEEMITANDDTQLWAEMGGQFFDHPIPPRQPRTFLPVSVDPLPNLPLVLPDGWKEYLSGKVAEWVREMGAEEAWKVGPGEMARFIHQVIIDDTPSWLQPISDNIITRMAVDFIAEMIDNTYGKVANLAGATAQIRLERRWSRPWGQE